MDTMLAIGSPLATAIRVFLAYGVLLYVSKRWVVNKPRRTARFLQQFIFAFLIAIAAALSMGITFDYRFGIVVIIGFIAAGGTFLKWKALAISASRDALFTFWDDVIAMALSFWILNEGQFLTPLVGLGIGLSGISVALFVTHYWKRKKKEDAENRRVGKEIKDDSAKVVPPRFYGYVAIYSVCWGIAVFGQRFWSLHDMQIQNFLLAWYTGTLISAILIRVFYVDSRADQRSNERFTVTDVSAHLAQGVLIYAALFLAFIAYKAPVVVVQPIFLVAEMVIGACVGLFFIPQNERKQFDPPEWFYFGIGFLGAIFVATGL